MDHAVALVQTYLQLNGYFTATEYPIIEALPDGTFRSVTDIDVLAFRFPSTRLVDFGRAVDDRRNEEPDALLDVSRNHIDLIIGEVKEGRATINSPVSDPRVLRAILGRFGCVEETDELIEELLRGGSVSTPEGYRLRVVIFGGLPRDAPPFPCRIVSLGHVLRFLQQYVRTHWEMLRHVQFKDPAFGFLMTLEKAKRGERRTRLKPVEGLERDRRLTALAGDAQPSARMDSKKRPAPRRTPSRAPRRRG